MPRLAAFFLYLIHAAYTLVGLASSLREHLSFARRREPQKLTAQRKQLPGHIALLLTYHDDTEVAETEQFGQQLIANVENVVAWCRATGIQRLTLYDRKGAFRCFHDFVDGGAGDRKADCSMFQACCLDSRLSSGPVCPPRSLEQGAPQATERKRKDQNQSILLHLRCLTTRRHARDHCLRTQTSL